MACYLLPDGHGRWQLSYDDRAKDRTPENLLRHLHYRMRALRSWRGELDYQASGWCAAVAGVLEFGKASTDEREVLVLADLLKHRPSSVWNPDGEKWLDYLTVAIRDIPGYELRRASPDLLEALLLDLMNGEMVEP